MDPRILVGCPVSDYHEYSTDRYLDAIRKINYSNYDVLLADNSKADDFSKKLQERGINVIRIEHSDAPKKRIIDSRNALREAVLEKNYDYFLSLEQDVIPPLDIIKKFISHNKEVVTGIYFNHYPGLNEPISLAFIETGIKGYGMRTLSDEELNSNRLLKINACGLGCVLIAKEILKKIKFRIDPRFDEFDDMPFCRDIRDKNIELYADTSVKCILLLKDRPWSWSDLD
ncbi:MAG: hypothetical protein AABX90_00685, partial [Nanoarchaeota archaeon]